MSVEIRELTSGLKIKQKKGDRREKEIQLSFK